jgi:hypothetical protein
VFFRDPPEVLEAADNDRLASYPRRWVAIAEGQAERGGCGSLEIIDRGWVPSVVSRGEFLARAVLMTALTFGPLPADGRMTRSARRSSTWG